MVQLWKKSGVLVGINQGTRVFELQVKRAKSKRERELEATGLRVVQGSC
jgi:hypothetical protein